MVTKVLLIVFVFMCVLAGVLFTQQDPVEQAKKQQDEKMQASAAEFIQATVVYYSIHNALPWFQEDELGANCFGGTFTLTAVPMNALDTCIKLFIAGSMIKKDYLTTTPLKSLTVTNPNPQTGEPLDTIVCFQPKSKVWQKDVNTRYNIDGTNVTNNRCHSQGGSEFCYWCTQ